MTQHPITPPPELRQLWAQQAQRLSPRDPVEWMQYVSEKAAHWGAGKEMEACCEWLRQRGVTLQIIGQLRAARRPKPPSLAEEARAHLDQLINAIGHEGALAMAEPIRHALDALERLQRLEANQ